MKKPKLTIGRTDIADFPSLRLKNINVKIDTGAFTASIHCHKISLVKRQNKQLLKFYLLDPSHPEYEGKALYVSEFKFKKVKSSNGLIEKRYVIPASIKLFKKTYPIELSLSNRGSMKYPVLIGRKFLLQKFIVDVSKRNLSCRSK